ncbi:hypothetical protein HHI36_014723 [Cryptolaemus montrouzieri]|uniref:Uncharacterized protein n=1 Tax=Cryptolaemus montrouzieri TaxID=559131 RepID=A0ABD2N3N7_9CUCU
MTQQTIIPAGRIFTEGVNWGIAYELPNKKIFLENLKEKKKHIIRRRDRRNLYENVELILENFGFNGKACIYRALCEASSKLAFEDKTITEKMVSILLRYPLEPIEQDEPDQHVYYHNATRLGYEDPTNCEGFLETCPISLIDLALTLFDGEFYLG